MGEKIYYEGEVGHERMVRYEWPDGRKQFYKGTKGCERVVCYMEGEGKPTVFYNGDRGFEKPYRFLLNGKEIFPTARSGFSKV